MSGLDDRNRRDVREALQRLPAAIGLFSRRIVVPVMAELQVRRQMNLLTTEALAVATLADAEIAVSTESPLLQEAAAEIGIAISVLR